MAKESIINTRLEDLIEVIDMRAYVSIFLKECGKPAGEASELLIKSDKVCFIVCDKKFKNFYGAFKVIGLSVILGNLSILIEEA